MICVMLVSMNEEIGSPLANVQESHSSSREFSAWLAQEPHSSSEKERQPPPESNGRFCTLVVVLLRKKPSRWQGNCNGRTHHTPCNETSLPEASSCPDRGLLGRLCRDAVELEASSAPIHHHLFEYSWEASIARESPEIQAREGAMRPCRVKSGSLAFASGASQSQQRWFVLQRRRSGHKETAGEDSAGMSTQWRQYGTIERLETRRTWTVRPNSTVRHINKGRAVFVLDRKTRP